MIEQVINDFPILKQEIRGKRLAYLDSGATAQKPRQVIDAISNFYLADNSNVHRGVHALSERSTALYEGVRKKTADFINAKSSKEIVFVKSTTEAINLVAQSYLKPLLNKGDEILISEMAHHANIVPWQLIAKEKGAELKVIPVLDCGELDIDKAHALMTDRTKLLAITHVSNVLGTINPVKELVDMAHAKSIPVLIDGAQAVLHQKVDVQDLDCEFYAFSSHKMYGPTGVGVLFGKYEILDSMTPYQGGGDMIMQVSWDKTEFQAPPTRFEAGTPNIAGVIGLGAAIEYINDLGIDSIYQYEQELLTYATEKLKTIPGLRIIGEANHKAAVVSFVLDGIHPHDIATILDVEGIAVRAGHHCAMPLMERFKVPATVRASMACYNSKEDIDQLVAGIKKVIEIFS